MKKIEVVFGPYTDTLDLLIDKYWDEYEEAAKNNKFKRHIDGQENTFWQYIEQKFKFKLEWIYRDNKDITRGTSGCELYFEDDADYLTFILKEM